MTVDDANRLKARLSKRPVAEGPECVMTAMWRPHAPSILHGDI
jgi:hypothetical protein